jgi:gliding-associated putative ABC transporter substrate-binding component GldG
MRTRNAVGIAIAAAVVVVLSLLSTAYFVRADLTEGREFTISESSRDMLAGLSDIVNITVYLSDDLPQHMTGFRTRLEDLLDEYRAYGGDRIRIAYRDPTDDPELERQAQLAGIRPVQLQALERDRAEVVNAYLGITVRYEDRQEVIPVVFVLDRLEYELTSSIVKVLAESLPVVGFLAGHGERGLGTDYRAVAEELRRNYEVREVVLSDDPTALDDVVTLVVAGSPHIPDEELYAIDQFIMRGGRAIFLLDGAELPERGLQAEPADGNVFDFVSSYGATVESDLVIDRINANAAFQTGFMTMSMPYPYWPKAIPPNLSETNPAVSELDAVSFPWTSSITLPGEPPEGVEIDVLARSSGYSWTVPATADLNPRQPFAPAGEGAQAIARGEGPGSALAVALTGSFKSAFAGRPLIVEDGEGGASVTEPEGAVLTSEVTQIVVIGNSRMFEDGLLGQLPGNLVLFLNTVDWLTLGETLIGIRSRAVEDRPLATLTDPQRATTKSLATFAVPAALVAVGLIRTAARRRRRAGAARLGGR